jgi:hypothetical protein
MGGACFWFDLPRVSARSTNLDSPR